MSLVSALADRLLARCFGLLPPSTTFHSYKALEGTRHRRLANADQNMPDVVTASAWRCPRSGCCSQVVRWKSREAEKPRPAVRARDPSHPTITIECRAPSGVDRSQPRRQRRFCPIAGRSAKSRRCLGFAPAARWRHRRTYCRHRPGRNRAPRHSPPPRHSCPDPSAHWWAD